MITAGALLGPTSFAVMGYFKFHPLGFMDSWGGGSGVGAVSYRTLETLMSFLIFDPPSPSRNGANPIVPCDCARMALVK